MRKPLAPLRWLWLYPEWAAMGAIAGGLLGYVTFLAWRA
jgi:hypothetical protein